MSTYEPGDSVLVRGQVLNVDAEQVLVEFFSKTDQWNGWIRADLLTSGVVIDLPDFAWAAKVLRNPGVGAMDTRTRIADQIEQQTKQPRIPEPGLWGVVEAGVKEHDQRLRWVRLGDNYRPDDRDEYDRLWCDLIDPTLVLPGIEEES